MTPLRAQAEQVWNTLDQLRRQPGWERAGKHELEAFAKRVQADECEACAHEADLHTGPLYSAEGNAAGKRIAAAIRQRGGQG